TRLNIWIESRTRLCFSARYIEQLILAGRAKGTRHFAAQIIRKVVPLERIKPKLEAQPDEKTGGNQRQKERAEGVEIPARRPDERFLATPLLRVRHGYFSCFSLRRMSSSWACAALVFCTCRKRILTSSRVSFSPHSSGSSVLISSI